MSDTHENLYMIIEVAEKHEEAVKLALNRLAAERHAFARNLETMKQEVQQAVSDAVAASMAESAKTIAAQADKSLTPVFDKLSNVMLLARQAETILHQVILWAGWRLVTRGVGAVAMIGVLLWLAIAGAWWWDRARIGALQAQKAGLEAEIATLQANGAGWKQSGAVARLSHCGAGNRLCVPVDSNAGVFNDGGQNFWIIQGY